ncbi:MAG: hypothetical protein ACLVI6_09055, partial [Bifidobacterium bifidum]
TPDGVAVLTTVAGADCAPAPFTYGQSAGLSVWRFSSPTTPDGVAVLTTVAGADCAPVCLLLITESPLGSPFLFFEGLF